MSGIVGSVVDRVTDAPLAASGAGSPRAGGMDFSIGGLYFKVDSTDQNPYQRATAQFRKDQLDTSQSYGDQSLVGYWTRGQFSFHMGAGVVYYDNDPAVENRFDSSTGVDVRVAGKATMWAGPGATTSGSSITRVVHNDADVAAYIDNGSLHVAGSMVSGPTTVTDLTTDGTSFYVSTGGSSGQVWSVTDAGVATEQYTHTQAIDLLVFAKSRLLMVDHSGGVYELAPAATTPPQATASGDLICTLTVPVDGKWCGSESPGGIYVGGGRNVYVFNVDASGGLPTLSAGVVALRLPPGETVRGVAYNLGALILATSKGVRVGQINNVFGSDRISFGPLLRCYGSGSDSVAFAAGGAVVIDGDLWFVDLSEELGNTVEYSFHRVASGNFVGASANSLGLVPFSASTITPLTGTPVSGSLQTGLIRFDTIEAKKFENVRVRASGAGGVIRVSVVGPDGDTTALYSLDVAQQKDVVLSTTKSSPIEAIALLFEFSPDDDGNTPTLLGYQVHALPCPTRQRMIRVPLMCFDHEVRPAAPRTGHRGAAWERLNALENMEKSGGTFTFTDYRTGETGECFIESVEFSGTTPPGPKSAAFGGTLFVTLRKL